MQNEMVPYFPLVGKWIVWKVGAGNRMIIEEEPLVGCDEDFQFPRFMMEDLIGKGLIYVHHVAGLLNSTIFKCNLGIYW